MSFAPRLSERFDFAFSIGAATTFSTAPAAAVFTPSNVPLSTTVCGA